MFWQILLWELGSDQHLPLHFRIVSPMGQVVHWDSQLTAGVYRLVEEVIIAGSLVLL